MNTKNTFTTIILSLYAIAMFYLSGIFWIIEFIISLVIYTLIFYFFHFIWIKIRKKPIMYFWDFTQYFLNRVSVLLIVITTIIWWLAYLFNEIIPAPMPEYTITDGTKTVKFQAMSHIWTPNFYNQIVTNLTNFKKEWWVYFFEWVKPGTKENSEKFNKAIGIQFDDDLYKNFSKLYGVTNQDNSKFMGLENDLDFNVDLNMDEIVSLYDEKMSQKPEWEKEYKSNLPIDANKTIMDALVWLNDRQLKLLVYINQAILNFIIWSENTQSFLTDNFANKDLFDVILWERNQVLAEAIINSEHDKIYITYWLLHFKWVMKLLQEHDSKWKIYWEKYLYPIKN